MGSTFGGFIDLSKCRAPEIIEGSEENGDYTVQGALMITDAGSERLRELAKQRGWKGKYKPGDGGKSPLSTSAEFFEGSGIGLRGEPRTIKRVCSMCKKEENRDE